MWDDYGGYSTMGMKTKIDDRGRITIPNALREKYGISPGDEIKIEDHDGKIILNVERRPIKKLKYGKKWDKQVFFKTGEITFEE